MNPDSPDPKPDSFEPLLVALSCSVAGVLPLLVGAFDPLLWTAWISMIAFPTGLFTGASGLKAWPFGLATPGIWMIVLVCLEAMSGGTLPEPAWAAAAWTGQFIVGMAAGVFFTGRAWRAAGLGLCLTSLLCVLPVSGGSGEALWGGRSLGQTSPRTAALVFGSSPMTMVMESGGVDWMRHPVVYDPAGTEWFSDRREPYRGKLAAPAVLLLGYLGLLLTRSRARAAWTLE